MQHLAHTASISYIRRNLVHGKYHKIFLNNLQLTKFNQNSRREKEKQIGPKNLHAVGAIASMAMRVAREADVKKKRKIGRALVHFVVAASVESPSCLQSFPLLCVGKMRDMESTRWEYSREHQNIAQAAQIQLAFYALHSLLSDSQSISCLCSQKPCALFVVIYAPSLE
jgi:hypothetical protein